ncbi:hypothetical protein F5Y15DRAFT_206410 [Xylariaceae sp. FL0016]|nr:hypothetical protein F5Y15DRAFT_206410 [Xylariaceae sp. FL0016]
MLCRGYYFSTLERLRFAQTSGILDQNTNDNIAHRRLKQPKPSKVAAVHPDWTGPRPISSPACRDPASFVEPLTLAKLPAKIREKHLSRAEQLLVAKQLRESVILDAADEAIYRIGRRADRTVSPQIYTPTLSSSARPSMDSSSDKREPQDQTHDAFYDSFRWLDEDEDLDLRLALDDYHADLKEPKPLSAQEPPTSFRRRLSISKMPFGRASLSSSRPGTKDSPNPSPVSYPPQTRRKSRALSLITPKHTSQASIASIDPTATHYQDPEARLKLRVYLASPQKFDEAVEFGFPSNEVRAAGRETGNKNTGARQLRGPLSADSENFKTFFADDQSSTYSEDLSMPDSDSPRTPNTPDKNPQAIKPFQPLDDTDGHHHKRPEGYAQAPAASREMTLRMTLTRPDLRACEDQIYGKQHAGRTSQSTSHRPDMAGSALQNRDTTKESMDNIWAEIDQELHSQPDGVVKRFWNRVRRN